MNTEILDASYWDNRYRQHQTGWDIGAPSTPLKTFIDQLTDKNISIFIPGCGNGYEAEYLLQQGFQQLTVIDISPVLTAQLAGRLQQYAGKELRVITGDFYEHEGQYQLILEQTFFSVFPPELREKYVIHMNKLLAPGGTLAGVLFNREFEGGPPFGGTIESYLPIFQKHLQLKKMEPCYNSIKPREGTEAFFIAGNLLTPPVPAGSGSENFPGPK